MKIAFVYDAIYPWVKGGAEMRIYEIGKRLSSRGYEVHLFGIKWWEGEDTIEYEGLTLHGVCEARSLYVNGRRSISEALVFSLKLFSKLRKERFDLIDVSVFPYFSCFTVKTVSILKKTPVIFTWHEVWNGYWYEYLGKAGFFGYMIEKVISKISGNNIAVSDWTKNRLVAFGTPEEKIAVIPNGIDIKRISEIRSQGRQDSKGQESKGQGTVGAEIKICDVIFVGRLIKEKNVNVLIKSIALLKNSFPKLRCCIVGDGPEKETLMKLSKEIGVYGNLDFAGFQEYTALIGKIKASRVLVLPSSREGFGMVVIEAFACGVPVVTVKEKYNAAQGLVEEGVDGFVVELKDSEIAKSIGRIIKDEACYKKLSALSSRKAGEYDWEKIVSKLVIYYNRLKV